MTSQKQKKYRRSANRLPVVELPTGCKAPNLPQTSPNPGRRQETSRYKMCSNNQLAQTNSEIWCCANRLSVVELPTERKAPNLPQTSPETRSGSTPDRSGRREKTSRKYRRVQSECAYAPKSKGFGIHCTYGAVPKPRDRGVKRGKTSRRAWSC